MKKSDLQTGMIIETRDKTRFLVLRGELTTKDNKEELFFMGIDLYCSCYYYNDNLTHSIESSNDVMKVFKSQGLGIFENTLKYALELIWERKEVDWSKVPVDTKVLVRTQDTEEWNKRYFSKYENGRFYTFNDGKTSFTCKQCTDWEYCILYEGNEYLVERND